MTAQQRNNLVNIFVQTLVFGTYAVFLPKLIGDGLYDGAAGFQEMGQLLLKLIVTTVVLSLVLIILFPFVYAKITRQTFPGFVVDERDKKFELWGLRIGSFVSAIGYLFSVIAIANGYGPVTALHIIVFSFTLGTITDNSLQLFFSRRGE